MKPAIIDTGPLVALFNRNDKYFTDAVKFIKEKGYYLFSTLAVVTEVTYLLSFNINSQTDFLFWLSLGRIEIIHMDENDFSQCSELMKKYHNVPMDFADATLVNLCENLNTNLVVTIDSDFDIYRLKRGKHIKNVFYD